MNAFEELEQKAEAQIAAKLGIYQRAAPSMGVTFAVLMLCFAVLMLLGGAFAGALLSFATSIVLLWFVSIIRSARAALST